MGDTGGGVGPGMTPPPTLTPDVPPIVSVPQPTQADEGPVREATGERGAAAATTVPGGSV